MKRKLVVHGVCFIALFTTVLLSFRWWMVTVKKSKLFFYLFFLIIGYGHFLSFYDKILQYSKVLTAYINFEVCIFLLYYHFIILKMLIQGFLAYVY